LRYLGGGALAATLGTAGCVQQADDGGSTATDAGTADAATEADDGDEDAPQAAFFNPYDSTPPKK